MADKKSHPATESHTTSRKRATPSYRKPRSHPRRKLTDEEKALRKQWTLVAKRSEVDFLTRNEFLVYVYRNPLGQERTCRNIRTKGKLAEKTEFEKDGETYRRYHYEYPSGHTRNVTVKVSKSTQVKKTLKELCEEDKARVHEYAALLAKARAAESPSESEAPKESA